MIIRPKSSMAAARFLAACLATSAMTPAYALASPTATQAVQDFHIAAQPLQSALLEFSQQSQSPVVASTALVQGLSAPAVDGRMGQGQALMALLAGTGLSATQSTDGGWAISRKADAPQSGSAAGDGADGTVAALVVTAQKREEQIQDVPIAISAFTEKALEEQKIEGGFDLLKAIPNVTFSKNNFTGYNFSIRGVGTKAVSATTDPGVAVSFNNIALIQNRLFEQEYFDVERVEVLRGPQGTLYGRNATAGVVNMISAKPNLHEFSAWVKGEVGNYDTRRVSGMVNIPIVDDKLAVRLAGALTKRSGYDYNSVTNHAINGRDLWSGRITVGFNPTDAIRSNLIWEHFNEDDNRSRTGKQLCWRDPGLKTIGSTSVDVGDSEQDMPREALFSQGCKPGSLYDTRAFGTPNGLSEPFLVVLGTAFYNNNGVPSRLILPRDPYGGMMQSGDLRVVASLRDPKYRAKADLIELNLDLSLPHNLTLSSQSAYDKDQVYSFQDYNRFNTLPAFSDTSSWIANNQNVNDYSRIAPGGVFCDPQIGCTNTIAGYDISSAKSKQFTQEIRLQSDFAGPINFSFGANYTKFNVLVDYYVMYNAITLIDVATPYFNSLNPNLPTIDPAARQFPCNLNGWQGTQIPAPDFLVCPYVDPNPVESMNGEGHNYFRSKNPYKLSSSAAFGEVYWKIRDDLKLTAGVRYTDDRKAFTPVPSQVLLAPGSAGGGVVTRGYPEDPAIEQHWEEFTGRLGIDWKPDIALTDQTLFYAFYSRGYKGGGANPPQPDFATPAESIQQMIEMHVPEFAIEHWQQFGLLPILSLPKRDYGDTFKPEFVNAFELGTKNTLVGGALTFNADTFFYDYKDYQVSEIRDRTAVNENFDARVWGAEFETAFAPTANLKIIGNLGYNDTSIGRGMKSIDIMNRTQGNPDFVLTKPWVQLPSNCIVPKAVAEGWVQSSIFYTEMCGGVGGFLKAYTGGPIIDPATGQAYDPNYYNGENGTVNINGGAGIYADLSGKKLPNSPHWTANLGAQYTIHLGSSWTATTRADAYWQSQSWARVYNAVNDKLHGWYNANLSVWFERPDDGLKIELYAKNLFDKTPITDAFINSDETALTTNVFVLDPRLIGLSVKKGF